MAAGDSAAGGADRNDISDFQVGCTCADLQHLASDIHLADQQVICIRMLRDFFHPSDNDFLKVMVESLPSLDLGAGHGHFVEIFLVCAGKTGNVFFNPIQ